ncbi:ABC transporter ATP-binding protein [Platysternon megacephalum]|uniref:ABC transporter ATP-binding protein n=1 Tax=Platysternon megacephalum TaxID=55544 RepID=A0A4D9DLR4_9SAUR|nr:ABC transporter ATP-binding protein [Platysternon megacephalum]
MGAGWGRSTGAGCGMGLTIVLLNLYWNPQNTAQSADSSHCHVSDVEVQEHYNNFFEVFTELEEKYGEIEEMNVCRMGRAAPVTDFRESCCRQYEMGECTHGGFCNFMHLRPMSRELRYGRP